MMKRGKTRKNIGKPTQTQEESEKHLMGIQLYWSDVIKEIKSILGFEIEYNFQTIYLCNLQTDLNSRISTF